LYSATHLFFRLDLNSQVATAMGVMSGSHLHRVVSMVIPGLTRNPGCLLDSCHRMKSGKSFAGMMGSFAMNDGLTKTNRSSPLGGGFLRPPALREEPHELFVVRRRRKRRVFIRSVTRSFRSPAFPPRRRLKTELPCLALLKRLQAFKPHNTYRSEVLFGQIFRDSSIFRGKNANECEYLPVRRTGRFAVFAFGSSQGSMKEEAGCSEIRKGRDSFEPECSQLGNGHWPRRPQPEPFCHHGRE